MNYKLIKDKKEFDKFIDFLPELKDNEGYFVMLIARNKWAKDTGLKSTTKLKRDTATTKENIHRIIKQWEVEEKFYTSTKDGVITHIPIENLCVYMGYNPKCQLKAVSYLAKLCMDAVISKRKNINVKSMANDAIQRSPGSRNFIDVDVDFKEDEKQETIVKFIKNIIGEEAGTFIKTSSGFHCLINKDKLKGDKEWYKKLKNNKFKSEFKTMANDLIPVPGCNQGSFVPYMMDLKQV